MAWSYHGSSDSDSCYVGSKKKMFKVGCEFLNQMKGTRWGAGADKRRSPVVLVDWSFNL